MFVGYEKGKEEFIGFGCFWVGCGFDWGRECTK